MTHLIAMKSSLTSEMKLMMAESAWVLSKASTVAKIFSMQSSALLNSLTTFSDTTQPEESSEKATYRQLYLTPLVSYFYLSQKHLRSRPGCR